jgi:hypothetical protein
MKKDQSFRPSQAPVRGKKTYASPELQEWGSVLDLTRGKKASLEDMPAKGGSNPI